MDDEAATAGETRREAQRGRGRGGPGAQPHAATRAVYLSFVVAGFIFASWASRIPQVKAGLRLSPGTLGLVLLCGTVGALAASSTAGLVITRLGEARTVATMVLVASLGTAIVAIGYEHGIVPLAIGLAVFGYGSGSWDVAQNVQGAAVERALGRAIMPRFHAGWSIGTVAGAGLGAVMVALGVPVTAHLLAVSVVVAVAIPASTRSYLPLPAVGPAEEAAVRRSPLAAWTEPRTLLIGLFVLCMTFSEATGNDWLSLAVISGYHQPAAVGTAGLTVFLAAMTGGRWFGPALLDRHGRVPVLRVGAAVAVAGLLLIDVGTVLPMALAGALLMGLGTSLGFPVGLSSAADDPLYAAARVSTAASIGYGAFLAGPPLIGFLSDHVGVKHGVSAAAILVVVAFVIAGACRPVSTQ